MWFIRFMELHFYAQEYAGNYWERCGPGTRMENWHFTGRAEVEMEMSVVWPCSNHDMVKRATNRAGCSGSLFYGVTTKRRPESMSWSCAFSPSSVLAHPGWMGQPHSSQCWLYGWCLLTAKDQANSLPLEHEVCKEHPLWVYASSFLHSAELEQSLWGAPPIVMYMRKHLLHFDWFSLRMWYFILWASSSLYWFCPFSKFSFCWEKQKAEFHHSCVICDFQKWPWGQRVLISPG